MLFTGALKFPRNLFTVLLREYIFSHWDFYIVDIVMEHVLLTEFASTTDIICVIEFQNCAVLMVVVDYKNHK